MMRKPTASRQIACNELISPEGQSLTLYVIQVVEGYVADYFPLSHELPHTEWFQGQIRLVRTEGGLRAYYNDDLIT